MAGKCLIHYTMPLGWDFSWQVNFYFWNIAWTSHRTIRLNALDECQTKLQLNIRHHLVLIGSRGVTQSPPHNQNLRKIFFRAQFFGAKKIQTFDWFFCGDGGGSSRHSSILVHMSTRANCRHFFVGAKNFNRKFSTWTKNLFWLTTEVGETEVGPTFF